MFLHICTHKNKDFSLFSVWGSLTDSHCSQIRLFILQSCLSSLGSGTTHLCGDTDQVSVGGRLGYVPSKFLGGDFRGRLAVTYDGQQADKQQSAEHPGAIHGTGPGGGGRRSRRVRRQQIRTGGAQVAAGPQESLPPPPQLPLSYTESQSPAQGGQMCGGALAVREDGGRLSLHEHIQVKVA